MPVLHKRQDEGMAELFSSYFNFMLQ